GLGYAEEETRALYASIARLATTVARTPFVTIVDGAFLKRWQRDLFRNAARQAGVPFVVVHLEIPESVAKQRIATRRARGTDASEADARVLELQLASEEPLGDDEARETIACPADRESDVEAIAARILTALNAQH